MTANVPELAGFPRLPARKLFLSKLSSDLPIELQLTLP
jgi:hypothetical protein